MNIIINLEGVRIQTRVQQQS